MSNRILKLTKFTCFWSLFWSYCRRARSQCYCVHSWSWFHKKITMLDPYLKRPWLVCKWLKTRQPHGKTGTQGNQTKKRFCRNMTKDVLVLFANTLNHFDLTEKFAVFPFLITRFAFADKFPSNWSVTFDTFVCIKNFCDYSQFQNSQRFFWLIFKRNHSESEFQQRFFDKRIRIWIFYCSFFGTWQFRRAE